MSKDGTTARLLSRQGHPLSYIVNYSRYPIWKVRIVETRESIIADLRKLGVKVNQILIYNPSTPQLKEMRDGLLRLHKANPSKNF
jgi:hypothetical protein